MGKCTIQILSGGRVQEPAIYEGVTWETSRKGEPGKLNFTCIKDEGLSFSEGAQVILRYDGKDVFHGFVFTKGRNKEQHIEVTAYDQLRYLKGKQTYGGKGFEAIRADQIVKRIAEDYQLNLGHIANTGFAIRNFSSENQTLFDTILDALDETVMNTGKLYFLYDDFGKLTLKNITEAQTDYLIDRETAEDFDYTSSIDNETYNRILLVNKSKSDGRNEAAKVTDYTKIGQWGVLQYYEEGQYENTAFAKQKAEALLKIHNKVYRTLSIDGCLGDVRVRGGSGVYVDLHLGDMIAKQRMLVEKATHTFDKDHHYMKLELSGCEEFYG